MRLQYLCSVVTDEMENAFPRMIQPALSIPDYMTNLTPNAVAFLRDWKIENLLGCAFAQPLFVPHNQLNSTAVVAVDDGAYLRSGLPNVSWNSLTISGSYALQAFAYRPWSYQYYDILCTNEAAASSMLVETETGALSNVQGFSAWVTHNHWHNVDPAAVNPSYWEIEWVVDGTIYNIRGEAGKYTRMDQSADGVVYKTINSRIKTGNTLAGLGNARPEANAEAVFVEVLCLNTLMMISIGGTLQPYVVQIPGKPPYPMVESVRITAGNFTQFSWHLHPIKFAVNPSLTSAQKQLGVTPDASTPLHYLVTSLTEGHALEDGDTFTENGATIEIDTENGGETPQYTLQMTNTTEGSYNDTDYSSLTAGIARVSTVLDGLADVRPYAPRPLVPKEIVETISLNLNDLCLSHTLDVTVSNFLGIDYLNENYGLRGNGNLHVAARLGWAHFPPGPDGYPGNQHFYGFCNRWSFRRSSGGVAHLMLGCVDQMQQLADSLISAPPDVDGWNHYTAAAYFAMAAGITPLQMAFADMVPTLGGGTLLSDPGGKPDPYGVAPNDPTPGGYFLPFGDGMNPWTPRNRTLPVLELMQFIRKVTGYLLFFDAFGFLRYEPWIPPSATAPKKVFTEYATGYDGGDLTEMFDLTITSGTQNTTNITTLVGIDQFGPEWAPLVTQRTDEDSISVLPGVEPPLNHIGYKKHQVLMDPRFANPAFADRACDALHAIGRLPDFDVSFSCWMQPDIYPMDVIYVDDPKSNSMGVPFYVMQVVNRMSVMGRNLEISSNISGKFLI